jgi:hypothetical protein
MRFRYEILFLFILVGVAEGEIIELCPNPYGSDGAEYIKAFCAKNCSLTDGEGYIEFNGSIVAAKNATAFYNTFGYKPDVEFPSKFALANSGETIYLFEDGVLIDSFTYGKDLNYLDEGVVYFRGEDWDFRYQDWSNFSAVEDNVSGRIIISPASYSIEAEEKVVLASYTFTNFKLLELAERASIEVFLDANPVGGIPVEEIEIAKDLKVHFLNSNSLKNFHYKFAIIDGRIVIITTENWKWNKRGYIVEFESERIADFLEDVLRHDLRYEGKAGNVGGISGNGFGGSGREFKFDARIEVFVLPDTNPIFGVISNASERLYIQVPYLDFQWFDGMPLLDSILSAAKNGTEVKILLDGKHAERNQKTVEFINEIGRRKNLNMEAKIMEAMPLHAKMVVADDISIITSANFNRYGLKLNREVGIIIYSKDVSDFLAEQFIEDWSGKSINLIYAIPAILLISLSIAVTYKVMKRT